MIFTLDSPLSDTEEPEFETLMQEYFPGWGYSGTTYNISIDWLDFDITFNISNFFGRYESSVSIYANSANHYRVKLFYFAICEKNEAYNLYLLLDSTKNTTFFDFIKDHLLSHNDIIQYNNAHLTNITIIYGTDAFSQWSINDEYSNYFYYYNNISHPYIMNQYDGITFSATASYWQSFGNTWFFDVTEYDISGLWYCMNCYNPNTKEFNSTFNLDINVINSNIYGESATVSEWARTAYLTIESTQNTLCPRTRASNDSDSDDDSFYSHEIFVPGNIYEIRVYATWKGESWTYIKFYIYINIAPIPGICNVNPLYNGTSLETVFKFECGNANDPDYNTTLLLSNNSSSNNDFNHNGSIYYNLAVSDLLLSDAFVMDYLDINTLLWSGVLTVNGIFKDEFDGISCISFNMTVNTYSNNVNDVFNQVETIIENENISDSTVFTTATVVNRAIDDVFFGNNQSEDNTANRYAPFSSLSFAQNSMVCFVFLFLVTNDTIYPIIVRC